MTYHTGTMDSSDQTSLDQKVIDATLATGGAMAVYFADGVNIGNLDGAAGLAVGVGLQPVVQITGSSTPYTFGTNDGVDALADFQNDAVDTTVFVSDNDTVILGSTSEFTAITVALTTGASNSINSTYEYSTGETTWTSFTPNDSTRDWRQSGNLYWGAGVLTGWATSGGNYLVRITRTRNSLGTSPVVSTVSPQGTDSSYRWDAAGNLYIGCIRLDIAKTPQGATAPAGMSAGQVWIDTSGSDSEDKAVKITLVDT